jgi:hypothetical protein
MNEITLKIALFWSLKFQCLGLFPLLSHNLNENNKKSQTFIKINKMFIKSMEIKSNDFLKNENEIKKNRYKMIDNNKNHLKKGIKI